VLPIREDYQTCTPPSWLKNTICQLLSSLVPEHVAGLAAIVLTNSSRIRKVKSRRVARNNRPKRLQRAVPVKETL
jgi:hypothetical protein